MSKRTVTKVGEVVEGVGLEQLQQSFADWEEDELASFLSRTP